MSQLTEEQMHFLKQYDHLLQTMSEGFEYLEENIKEEAPPQVDQVFADIVQAMQQLNQGNQQLAAILEKPEQIKPLMEDFQDIVNMMTEWFELNTVDGRYSLLNNRVVPTFESWRYSMHELLKPYVSH
ncbi:hypothetical protein [Pontibacillus marinus]|uniref:DUF8042 domain-containing protein n=1 Tax=Pontibacillus marinus BH030004 = DSM 16465 TaxID=1385511 RepID=A0A0A5HT45_9BACI|nr:hypothetical protein [Pontibacillus marinus]KGX86807.1 hypothetical protein N783_11595 [Pontibacillus marinus BH030004 = DSM 16465]